MNTEKILKDTSQVLTELFYRVLQVDNLILHNILVYNFLTKYFSFRTKFRIMFLCSYSILCNCFVFTYSNYIINNLLQPNSNTNLDTDYKLFCVDV